MATIIADVLERIEAVAGASGRPVTLHEPDLDETDAQGVAECVRSGWVSSAGRFVTEFEERLAGFTGAPHAVAVVNGTAALQVGLMLAGVGAGDEVFAPSLTFVATANAISHCGAVPHFIDVCEGRLGVDPSKLSDRLDEIGRVQEGVLRNRSTGRRLAAVVVMHAFGHPADIEGVMAVARRFGLPVVEDAAESLGSWSGGKHTGRFGTVGIFSFNGNKTITTGGGGAIVTEDGALAARAKHLTTTGKRPHAWEFFHDEVAFNYRMPNLNAALGCSQLAKLPLLLERKRRLAERYRAAFSGFESGTLVWEPAGCTSNFWLNTLVLDPGSAAELKPLLEASQRRGLQLRPAWTPMHRLPMYEQCPRMELGCTEALAARILNLPSSAKLA
jgi:perosamine synthetase